VRGYFPSGSGDNISQRALAYTITRNSENTSKRITRTRDRTAAWAKGRVRRHTLGDDPPADARRALTRLSLLEGFSTREGALNGHCGQKVCTKERCLFLFRELSARADARRRLGRQRELELFEQDFLIGFCSVSLSFSACAIFNAVLGLHDCYRSVAAASAPGSSKQRGSRVSGEEALDLLGPFLGCLLRISSAQLASLDGIRNCLIDLRWNPRLTSGGREYHVLK
jgi:hypothetical protein